MPVLRLDVSCNSIRSISGRLLAHFSVYLRPSRQLVENSCMCLYDGFHLYIAIIASLWAGSLQVSLHPQSSGRVRRTGRGIITRYRSLLPYSAWGKSHCRKNVMKEEEQAVFGGCFICVVFFVSELNFSAVSVCLLSFLKDFCISSAAP